MLDLGTIRKNLAGIKKRAWYDGDGHTYDAHRLSADLEYTKRGPFMVRDMDLLLAEVGRLQVQRDTAWAFIDASPCDPDITAEQRATYGPYLAARAALASVPQ